MSFFWFATFVLVGLLQLCLLISVPNKKLYTFFSLAVLGCTFLITALSFHTFGESTTHLSPEIYIAISLTTFSIVVLLQLIATFFGSFRLLQPTLLVFLLTHLAFFIFSFSTPSPNILWVDILLLLTSSQKIHFAMGLLTVVLLSVTTCMYWEHSLHRKYLTTIIHWPSANQLPLSHALQIGQIANWISLFLLIVAIFSGVFFWIQSTAMYSETLQIKIALTAVITFLLLLLVTFKAIRTNHLPYAKYILLLCTVLSWVLLLFPLYQL